MALPVRITAQQEDIQRREASRYGHRPLVSVVVLSHRFREQPGMVGEAIASVLNQTESDVELRVAYMRENRPTKLNDAVLGTCGQWVAVLCDDDLLHPQFVEMGMRIARDAPDVNVIYSDRKVFRSHEKPEDGFHFRMHGKALSGPGAYRIDITPGSFIFGMSLPMTCLIRRDLWDKLKGHDPKMPHSDTELWYRMAAVGAHFAYLPYPLFYYREHDGQMCRITNTMPHALRVFHRKHFKAFGIAFHPAQGFEIPGTSIPLERRLAYESAYLPSLTTAGYMALETKKIRTSAEAMIKLTQQQAEMKVNTSIRLVMEEEGVSAEDGWKLGPDYTLVREVPDPPADLTVAATDAITGVSGHLSLVGDEIRGASLGDVKEETHAAILDPLPYDTTR